MIRNLVPKSISPSCPNPGRREMVKLNFYFHTSLWCLKRFLKAFIKPFEAPQRSEIWSEIWSKSRFNFGEFEQFNCFMFFMKTTDKQNLADVFKENLNWLFCLILLDVERRFKQKTHIFQSVEI